MDSRLLDGEMGTPFSADVLITFQPASILHALFFLFLGAGNVAEISSAYKPIYSIM